MRVAVAGGTGVVGRHVVTALEAAGHEAVVLSRSGGVDRIERKCSTALPLKKGRGSVGKRGVEVSRCQGSRRTRDSDA